MRALSTARWEKNTIEGYYGEVYQESGCWGEGEGEGKGYRTVSGSKGVVWVEGPLAESEMTGAHTKHEETDQGRRGDRRQRSNA